LRKSDSLIALQGEVWRVFKSVLTAFGLMAVIFAGAILLGMHSTWLLMAGNWDELPSDAAVTNQVVGIIQAFWAAISIAVVIAFRTLSFRRSKVLQGAALGLSMLVTGSLILYPAFHYFAVSWPKVLFSLVAVICAHYVAFNFIRVRSDGGYPK
jgi:CBS-domain-containing membrane protein